MAGMATAFRSRLWALTGMVALLTLFPLSSIAADQPYTPFPRQIAMLYSSNDHPNHETSAAFLYAAFPLEYFGYVPEFIDFTQTLPELDPGKTQGIVAWFEHDTVPEEEAIWRWLVAQKNKGIKILFIDYFGFQTTANKLKPFGLTPITLGKNNRLKQTPGTPLSFEIDLAPPSKDLVDAVATVNSHPILQIISASAKSDAIALTSWGGYALYPYAMRFLPNEQARWVIDPLWLFQQGLQLPEAPIPDVTTENGRRLLISHIDGDGFASLAEWKSDKYCSEVILQDILQTYRIPVGISVIESDISPNGLYPQKSERLTQIAKKLFALPWAEIASHTFSHPFDWRKAQEGQASNDGKEGIDKAYFLPIPNYQFSIEREITGSVNYINQTLAPAGKSCQLLFWTGETNPSNEAVALSYQDGLLNINGGDTSITQSDHSLTRISPMGIKRGEYYQIFAPQQNENIYTNLWQGPFYGYRDVIETFKLTNQPHRFKPIDIYYHFYSGTKYAGLKALKTVYDWALEQPIHPIYTSDYIRKVLDFYTLAIEKEKGGIWRIKSDGQLRELRLPDSMGYPNFYKSSNVIGYQQQNGFRYIHLGSDKETVLSLQNKKPTQPFLEMANGKVMAFEHRTPSIRLVLKAEQKLIFTLSNIDSCEVLNHDQLIKPTRYAGSLQTFRLTERMADITIQCRTPRKDQHEKD